MNEAGDEFACRIKRVGCHMYAWVDFYTLKRCSPYSMNPLVLWYANIIAVRDEKTNDPRTVKRWGMAIREAKRMIQTDRSLIVKICRREYGFNSEYELMKSII